MWQKWDKETAKYKIAMVCWNCRQEGHMKRYCPQLQTSNVQEYDAELEAGTNHRYADALSS